MSHVEGDLRAAPSARFAILASRWNPRITDALVAGARKAFADNGVAETAIDVVRVPGAWELPLVAAKLGEAGGHVAIVALGCVVRGDTRHYEHVADLDGALAQFVDREVEQVDPIERAALRIATYELRHRPDVPYRVVINEAIDTTKRFGSEHGHTYVNGVLDHAAAAWRTAEFDASHK